MTVAKLAKDNLIKKLEGKCLEKVLEFKQSVLMTRKCLPEDVY